MWGPQARGSLVPQTAGAIAGYPGANPRPPGPRTLAGYREARTGSLAGRVPFGRHALTGPGSAPSKQAGTGHPEALS